MFLPLLFALGCDPRAKRNFVLDRYGPWYVAHLGSSSNKIAEVRLYVTGPQIDFDSYKSIEDILALKPQYVSVDSNEINQVLLCLGDYSEKTVPSNMMGTTYHIMLFESEPAQLMHFRVFAQDLTKDGRLMIYPKSTGFGYSNTKVCNWLREVMRKPSPNFTHSPPKKE